MVDTGVDFDHPDLRGRVVKAQSFVDRGEQSFTSDIHGTAVAGLIAATANNDVGIVGVAPRGGDLRPQGLLAAAAGGARGGVQQLHAGQGGGLRHPPGGAGAQLQPRRPARIRCSAG